MAQKKQSKNTFRGAEEMRDEFDQEIIDISRVTRVMAGGKRMRFRACVAVGNHKGKIGIGIAKGADVSLAISKATNDAKKHIVKINMTKEGTIPHTVRIRLHSANLLIKPAPVGTGIIAGSVLRQILELVGLRDVVARILGTSNKVNNAKAAVDALLSMKLPRVRKEKKFTETEDRKNEKNDENKIREK